MQEIIIGPNQAGQRFDKFLNKYLPNAGNSFLYKMLRKKNITLNGKKAEGKELLVIGDKVQTFFAQETFDKFSGQTSEAHSQANDEIAAYQKAYEAIKGVEILSEDENTVFLAKPVGVLTQKAKDTDLSLNEWLIGYLLQTNAITNEELSTFKPSVCNRLDRNTSGLVLCGKSLKGSQELSRLIKTREVSKFYRTICVGNITASAHLEGYLTKDEKTNKVKVSKNQQSPEDTAIHTAYKPLTSNGKYTLLEVELITGKTHQIRAHLASIGHPIIGDGKYGQAKVNQELKKQFGLSHQLLHAYRLVFPDGKEIVAPYPKQFTTILEHLL